MKIIKDLEIEWVTSAKYPIQQGAKAAINKEDNVAEPTKAELQKSLDDITKERDDVKAELEKLQADHQELEVKLAKSEGRIAELEKAADVEPPKKQIYKALDGDAYFEGEERLAKAVRKSDLLEIEKEVSKEYGNLTGEDSAKARALLLVKAMPEAERETLERMLKSGNEAIAKTASMTRATRRKVEGDSANEQMNTLTKEYQKEHNVDFYKAYDEVRKSNPDLYEQAVNEGRP